MILNQSNFSSGSNREITDNDKTSPRWITDVCVPSLCTHFVFSKSSYLYQPGKKRMYLVQYKPWYEIKEHTSANIFKLTQPTYRI